MADWEDMEIEVNPIMARVEEELRLESEKIKKKEREQKKAKGGE